jgi:hypothetical protein
MIEEETKGDQGNLGDYAEEDDDVMDRAFKPNHKTGMIF